MSTAIGQWEDDDGLGGWSTNGRVAVGWRPHPWFNINVAWNGLGTHSNTEQFRLAFSLPLRKRAKPPQWAGLGLVGGGPKPSAVDPWSPVDNIDVIHVARRESASDPLVSAATVRFLQERASSGDEIGIEVLLPSVTSRDLDLVVTLGARHGRQPCRAGSGLCGRTRPGHDSRGNVQRRCHHSTPAEFRTERIPVSECHSKLGVLTKWRPLTSRGDGAHRNDYSFTQLEGDRVHSACRDDMHWTCGLWWRRWRWRFQTGHRRQRGPDDDRAAAVTGPSGLGGGFAIGERQQPGRRGDVHPVGELCGTAAPEPRRPRRCATTGRRTQPSRHRTHRWGRKR